MMKQVVTIFLKTPKLRELKRFCPRLSKGLVTYICSVSSSFLIPSSEIKSGIVNVSHSAEVLSKLKYFSYNLSYNLHVYIQQQI